MDYRKYNKPFPDYRWRWGASTPTENLNLPEVYFGCLQVLFRNQGKSPSDPDIHRDLEKVERDLANLDTPTLARKPERNLFRNSGQYWKVTGLLDTTRGGIKLTPLGNAYASGKITKSEFSALAIKTIAYPDRNIDSEEILHAWQEKSLEIKPLELILRVVCHLFGTSNSNGYITTEELTSVLIPMAGHGESAQTIAEGIIAYRNDKSLFSGSWTANDKDNDERIARELLLFLYNYDYLGLRNSQSESTAVNLNQEFYIYDEQFESIMNLLEISVDTLPEIKEKAVETAIDIDKKAQVLDAARERKQVEILSRPGQSRFRKDVLEASGGKCLLTGVTIKESLQACHIVPVKDKGTDHRSNGLILRADLHTLYDKGHIRILESGEVTVSDYIKDDPYYSKALPQKVEVPEYINSEAIRLRNEYMM